MVFKKNKHPKTEFKKGYKPWNKGRKDLPKLSDEHKQKISDKLKGRKLSKKHKKNLSKSRIGIKLSKETKAKISKIKKDNPSKYWIGKKHSEETKNKISKTKKGTIPWNKGIPMREESKKKCRIATINYIKTVKGFVYPMVGRNETQILNDLEKEIGYKIIRQLNIEGFFIDGYIPELNLCIEIDEKHHKKQIEKDKEREIIIKNKLNCDFMRIKDY